MNLHRLKKNQIKMMRDRGFTIDEEDENILQMTREDFDNMIQEAEEGEQILNKFYKTKGQPKTYVYFSTMSDINKNLAVEIVGTAREENCNNIVIIANHPQNSIKPDALTEFSQSFSKIKITVFPVDRLNVRPVKHSFSPKYRKLNDREKEEIIPQLPIKQMPLARLTDIREYKLETTQQRSKIFSDPAVEYLDLNPGDVVEVRGYNFAVDLLVTEYVTYYHIK